MSAVSDAHLVARIGRAHGLRGEVTVQVHTDDPSGRFVPGTEFPTEPAVAGPLRLRSVRVHNGIYLLAFDGTTDRTAAEGLRGIRLLAPAGRGAADAEPAQHPHADEAEDGWFPEDLRGLEVQDVSGVRLGTVADLHLRPHQDLLEITLVSGATAYLPFVEEIVPEVDEDAGVVTVDPPAGLLDLSE